MKSIVVSKEAIKPVMDHIFRLSFSVLQPFLCTGKIFSTLRNNQNLPSENVIMRFTKNFVEFFKQFVWYA